MWPAPNIKRFNKHIAVWSGRKKREVVVEVDYQSVSHGNFTLIHIARMRDSSGNDTHVGPRVIQLTK